MQIRETLVFNIAPVDVEHKDNLHDATNFPFLSFPSSLPVSSPLSSF